MPEYRVLRGTHRTEDGTRAEPGDTVELTEEERANLPAGKFEPVEEVESAAESESTADDTTAEVSDTDSSPDGEEDVSDASEDVTADEEESDDAAEAESADADETASDDAELSVEDEIPYDNYRLLSRMAADYGGDEIHGAMGADDITDHFESLDVETVRELRQSAEEEVGS